MKKKKDFLRLSDLAEMLNVSRTTLWKIRQNSDLNFPKGKQISKQVYIWSRKEIEKWLENNNGKIEKN